MLIGIVVTQPEALVGRIKAVFVERSREERTIQAGLNGGVVEDFDRISINPEICSGKPCITGTRVMVSNILGMFASDYSLQRILENYPGLTQADVIAALQYAAQMIDEEKVYLRSA